LSHVHSCICSYPYTQTTNRNSSNEHNFIVKET
jgi:hypothetical protein